MDPVVGILIGSESDRELIAPALQVLTEYQVPHELTVVSAHRNVLASWSMLPVIGIPLPTSDLRGVDSLLSIAQMPGGIPVTCVGIGKSGAKNAALAAIQILALQDDRLRLAYRTYRRKLAAQ
jgi:phosphoribosylcarboxyaminoimidazole (NCAIR) mutase